MKKVIITSLLNFLFFSIMFSQKTLSPKEEALLQKQEITGYLSSDKDSVTIEFPSELYPLKLKWGYVSFTIHDDSENEIFLLPFMESESISAQVFTTDDCFTVLNRNPILTKIVLKQKEEASLTSTETKN